MFCLLLELVFVVYYAFISEEIGRRKQEGSGIWAAYYPMSVKHMCR